MTTRIILCRHGNTFRPDQTPVWVGCRQDLPLVEAGERQARLVGEAVLRKGIRPSRVLCGELLRTRRFAEIVCEVAGLELKPEIEPRLNELDYGMWSGLSDAEVVAKFGRGPLDRWQNESVWPTDAGWGPGEQIVTARVDTLSAELASDPNGVSLLVSSNGLLRYFLRLDPETFIKFSRSGKAKVGTGRVCQMVRGPQGWRTELWNVTPDELMG